MWKFNFSFESVNAQLKRKPSSVFSRVPLPGICAKTD